MVANPKYDMSIDEFSFGVMMIHIFCGKWPEPECSQIRMEGGMMIPVTEAERRESFLKAIGDDHPLTKSIISCIHNDPSKRMHANEIVELMSEMVSQFPRKHLDLIEQMSRATERTLQGDEYKEYIKEYEDVVINEKENKPQHGFNDQILVKCILKVCTP